MCSKHTKTKTPAILPRSFFAVVHFTQVKKPLQPNHSKTAQKMFQKKQEWIENEKTEIFKRQIRHHKHFMMLNKKIMFWKQKTCMLKNNKWIPVFWFRITNHMQSKSVPGKWSRKNGMKWKKIQENENDPGKWSRKNGMKWKKIQENENDPGKWKWSRKMIQEKWNEMEKDPGKWKWSRKWSRKMKMIQENDPGKWSRKNGMKWKKIQENENDPGKWKWSRKMIQEKWNEMEKDPGKWKWSRKMIQENENDPGNDPGEIFTTWLPNAKAMESNTEVFSTFSHLEVNWKL